MNLGSRPQTSYPEQVCTLRRLIFSFSDILLITRTGFRKSFIFYAFLILTGKITIQLALLSKLRDEQLDNIRKLNGSNPYLITAESRNIDKAIIVKVKEGMYIYVLLSPKQASLKSFRTALKSPELQARIGLVTINKCYLVKQWEMF